MPKAFHSGQTLFATSIPVPNEKVVRKELTNSEAYDTENNARNSCMYVRYPYLYKSTNKESHGLKAWALEHQFMSGICNSFDYRRSLCTRTIQAASSATTRAPSHWRDFQSIATETTTPTAEVANNT